MEEERLPYQLKGRGFTVKLNLDEDTSGLVAALVDNQLHGFDTTEVIERTVCRYMENKQDMFERIGISLETSRLAGYSPVKFHEPGIEPKKWCNVHQDPPLYPEFYGVAAYTIDQCVARGLLGKTREEVVMQMLKRRISGLEPNQFEPYEDLDEEENDLESTDFTSPAFNPN